MKEMNVEKNYGNGNLWTATPSTDYDGQTVANVKYFKYGGSMMTSDARCTPEMKSRIIIIIIIIVCHGVGPLVDPFRSHVSGSLFKGLP
jgi:hypothetical protein